MPRTRTVTTTVYTFDELSPTARERALDHCRHWSVEDNEWWDSTFDTIITAGRILGIQIENERCHGQGNTYSRPRIYFSGFSSQGDGLSYEGTYHYAKGWKKALRKEFGGEMYDALLAIGQELQDAQRRAKWEASAHIAQTGRYHGLKVTVCIDGDEVWTGDTETDIEGDIGQALSDFASWAYRLLESEYEWLTGGEQVTEMIKMNEYEFTKEGEVA